MAKASAAKAKAKAKSKGGTKVVEKVVKTKPEEKEPVFLDDDKPGTRRKFVDMKPLPSDDELRRLWRVWSRDYKEWSGQLFDERTKIQSMMHALDETQKQLVYSRLPEEITSVAEVYGVLEVEYGADNTLQDMTDIRLYTEHTRTKTQSMRSWLTEETTLRLRYERASNRTDEANGHQFLLKCGLTITEQSEILRTWKLDMKRLVASGEPSRTQPTVSEITEYLRDTIMLEELNNGVAKGSTVLLTTTPGKGGGGKGGRKKKNFKKKFESKLTKKLTTLLTNLNMGGNGGNDKGSGVSSNVDWICGGCGKRIFSDRSTCFFCGKSKASTDLAAVGPRVASKGKGGGKAGGGKSNGKGKSGGKANGEKKPCHFFQKGTCRNGEQCTYAHVKKE